MSSNTQNAIVSFGGNVLMIVGFYFAIIENIAWVQYLMIGFIWVMLAAYLAATFPKANRKKYHPNLRNKFYSFITDFFDVAVVAALIASQWYLMACAYGASVLVQRVYCGRIVMRDIKGS